MKLTTDECFHYCLSLPVTAQVVGMTSMAQLQQNLKLVRNFQPLSKSDMEAFRLGTKSDMDALRTELRADMALVRQESRADVSLLRHELAAGLSALRKDMTIWLGSAQIIGMGQLTKLQGANEGEFALLINDEYQRTGLGTELLSRLLDIGRDEKLEKVVAEILPENEGMRRVCTKLGFSFSKVPDSNTIYAEIAL